MIKLSEVSQVYTKQGVKNFKDAQSRQDIKNIKTRMTNVENDIVSIEDSINQINSQLNNLSLASGNYF